MTRKKRAGTSSTDKGKSEAPAEVAGFEPIAAVLRKEGGVDPAPALGGRRAFGAGALKVRGKIFAMPAQGTLVLKLPSARVAALVAEGRGQRFDPGHGRLMKEWIALDGGEGEWLELAREAFAFVGRVP
jgi:hypothetical protein